jgi:hypothetical protein
MEGVRGDLNINAEELEAVAALESVRTRGYINRYLDTGNNRARYRKHSEFYWARNKAERRFYCGICDFAMDS